MSGSARDIQFAGFAELVFNDLKNNSLNVLADHPDWDHQVELQKKIDEDTKQVIARRAYDLVSHTLSNTGPMMIDCYSHEEQIAEIPDMRQWSEETK